MPSYEGLLTSEDVRLIQAYIVAAARQTLEAQAERDDSGDSHVGALPRLTAEETALRDHLEQHVTVLVKSSDRPIRVELGLLGNSYTHFP